MTIFSLMGVLLLAALRSTTQVWRRTSSRDLAVGQLLKARTNLTRDVMNASQLPQQFDTAQLGPSLGAGFDGDAFSILTCEDGQAAWNVTTDGASVLRAQVSYGLWVPNNVNARYGYTFSGVADAQGYEEGCPYKWLMRRQDAVPAPVAPNPFAAVASNWNTTLLTRPTNLTESPTYRAVATLTGFRVLASGGLWQFELRATAVEDARQKLPIGSSPLGSSPYTIVQRFSVPAHN